MAGLAKTLKASSLVEVTVAMVIIGTVFSVAMVIYLNIVSNSQSLYRTQQQLSMEQYISRTKQENAFWNETIEIEGNSFTRKVSVYQNARDLILLEFSVIDQQDREQGKHREIIYLPANGSKK